MKTLHLGKKRLHFEALEGRLVLSAMPTCAAVTANLAALHSTGTLSSPLGHSSVLTASSNLRMAPVATTSTNWSGYAAETNLSKPASGSVTSVSGTWNVPAVTSSGSATAYTSVWVGIDGYNSSTVEQIGTDSVIQNGTAVYDAWYEMYPNYAVNINLAIHPNDTISALVQYQTAGTYKGEFELSITDVTTGKSFTTYQSGGSAQRSSAEWIVEAPSSNSGILPLANFSNSPVTFKNATATINGTTGPIDSASWQAAKINMVSRSVTEDTTSALTDAGTASSFTVSYALASTTTPTTPTPHRHYWWYSWSTWRQPNIPSQSSTGLGNFLSDSLHNTNSQKDHAALDLLFSSPYFLEI